MKGCELLARAKVLAIKRGLDSTQVECPIADICKHNVCIYMSDLDQLQTEQEGTKLEGLREEIAEMVKKE